MEAFLFVFYDHLLPTAGEKYLRIPHKIRRLWLPLGFWFILPIPLLRSCACTFPSLEIVIWDPSVHTCSFDSPPLACASTSYSKSTYPSPSVVEAQSWVLTVRKHHHLCLWDLFDAQVEEYIMTFIIDGLYIMLICIEIDSIIHK